MFSKILTLLILFVSVSNTLLSQDNLKSKKSKKSKKKSLSKVTEKPVDIIVESDDISAIKKFDLENYHYKYENDSISITLTFIDKPGSESTLGKALLTSNDQNTNLFCDDYNAVLKIRNLGENDIKFKAGIKGRVPIDLKKLENNISPPLWGIESIILNPRMRLIANMVNMSTRNNNSNFQNGSIYSSPMMDNSCIFKDKIYAAGDSSSLYDIDQSTIYVRYKLLSGPDKSVIKYQNILNKDYQNSSNLQSFENNKDKSDDNNLMRGLTVVNYNFPDEIRINLSEYNSDIRLIINPSWTKKWRNEDADYPKRYSKFIEDNFGKVSNDKKIKKN